MTKDDGERTARRLPPMVDFGWGRDPMAKQLAGSGLDDLALAHIEKDAEAFIRLKLRGFISNAEARRVSGRISKSIEREFRKQAKAAAIDHTLPRRRLRPRLTRSRSRP